MQVDIELIERREQDLGRGTALLVSGAVMVLLKWILPPVAPVAIAAYGLYRLYYKDVGEGLLALALAVVAWVLRYPLGWLLWLGGAAMVGFGLFFVIRGLLADSSPTP
jgi:hypothetical protein